jgi:ketosteroid isomerase-like protein
VKDVFHLYFFKRQTSFMKLLLICVSFIFRPYFDQQQPAQQHELIQVDKAFSEMSRQKGMKAAFLAYIDDQGVLLRKNHYPLIGQQAKDLIEKMNDTSFSLTWEPGFASIAKSGELGYTYGIYTSKMKDTTAQGTYVTIWQKQKDGNWKFVLDTGNEGLGR